MKSTARILIYFLLIMITIYLWNYSNLS